MALAVASGATDAIGYLALGQVFTSAMTGNLVLLAISLGHPGGVNAAVVLLSLACFTAGAAVGARIAGTPQDGDTVWPPAITAALLLEVPIFVASAAFWWIADAHPGHPVRLAMLGGGAVALGIQSSAMQRFGAGLNTTFVSGSLALLTGRLVTVHRINDVLHHAMVLLGLVGGGVLAALIVWLAPMWAPAVQLAGLGVALAGAAWHAAHRPR
ncbi:DUF1275 domain-containing protein [Mycolicibacterium moriokaense]|nr:DUF1275 domain-containing protein [Mycolicibacterium moriokaense]